MFNSNTLKKDRESVLWEWLKKGLSRMTLKAHLQRIEDTTKKGTPDVEGKVETMSQFWTELKVAKEIPSKKAIRINTTPFQVYFAIKRASVGGLSWYLIRVGVGVKATHYLIPGALAEELIDKPISLTWLVKNSRCEPSDKAEDIVIKMAKNE